MAISLTIINLGVIVDHDCVIEEGVHVCIGAIVKGENRLTRCMKIEAGEVVERGQYPLGFPFSLACGVVE